MLRQLRSLYLRYRTSSNYTNDLDAILAQANPEAPLFGRLNWLVDLMQWVRYKSYLSDYKEVQDVKLPLVRLRFLMTLLDRHTEWKRRTAKTLHSLLIDIGFVELFAETGLPDELSFWSEFFNRLSMKVMPARPLTEGGIPLFSALFPESEDLLWFSKMSPELMDKLVELFVFEMENSVPFDHMVDDIEEALLILTSQVRSIGTHYLIRRRTGLRVKNSPFLELTLETRAAIEQRGKGSRENFIQHCQKLRDILERCFEQFQQAYRHLDQYGVSLKVVYLLENGHAKLKRIDDLLGLLAEERPQAKTLIRFVTELIKENQEKMGLWSLFEQNTRLISQKIMERNADKGEHYITQTRHEFKLMFKKASGGGALMSIAVIFKVLLGLLKLPEFLQGFVYSLNYSLIFVTIQLKGFTLATKQPAMTGPTLAAKMDLVHKGQPLDLLIDEIVKLIRTQIIGILGNVGAVIPCIVIMDFIHFTFIDIHMIRSSEMALKLMNTSHLLSFAPLYAAFTGVLLWLSSVLAGYMDNWFYLHRMKETLSFNRRLNYVIGQINSERLASFFERHIAGLTSNISLALFLGLLPQVLAFFGLYLEVRHVTLAAGNMALGAMHFGLQFLTRWDFWLSFIGLGLIGFLNVAVSFFLAMWVALKSRRSGESKKYEILLAVLQRFKSQPKSFIFPPSER